MAQNGSPAARNFFLSVPGAVALVPAAHFGRAGQAAIDVRRNCISSAITVGPSFDKPSSTIFPRTPAQNRLGSVYAKEPFRRNPKSRDWLICRVTRTGWQISNSRLIRFDEHSVHLPRQELPRQWRRPPHHHGPWPHNEFIRRFLIHVPAHEASTASVHMASSERQPCRQLSPEDQTTLLEPKTPDRQHVNNGSINLIPITNLVSSHCLVLLRRTTDHHRHNRRQPATQERRQKPTQGLQHDARTKHYDKHPQPQGDIHLRTDHSIP